MVFFSRNRANNFIVYNFELIYSSVLCRTSKLVEYVRNNTDYSFDSPFDWSNSKLAIQQRMGIWSCRWARPCVNYHYHLDFIRKNIRQ